MTDQQRATKQTIVLFADQGRRYDMGAMRAVFKADGDETDDRYSIAEWWLEPNTPGPGAHRHEANDDVFYVLQGTASFLVGDRWIDVADGSFIRIPAGVMHDFVNRSDKKVGLLNFYIPGGFEKDMPAIVKWFEEN